jgi:hypothetical protein
MGEPAEVGCVAFVPRNNAVTFARRTRANLEFIDKAAPDHENLHPITQLANSLLGLVVFPKEQKFLEDAEKIDLAQLSEKEWPQWEFLIGSSTTLGQLIRRLRNAITHGHVIFSSDSRIYEEVWLEVSDYRENKKLKRFELCWKAKISSADLRLFCMKLIKLIEESD